MAITADDIVVKIFDPAGPLLASERPRPPAPRSRPTPRTRSPAGIYSMQVCPFDGPDRAVRRRRATTPPASPRATARTPTGRALGQPAVALLHRQPDPRLVGDDHADELASSAAGPPAPGCTSPTGPFRNVAAAGPWDYRVRPASPSFTTVGNNANTHEAWASPLTPRRHRAGAGLADP